MVYSRLFKSEKHETHISSSQERKIEGSHESVRGRGLALDHKGEKGNAVAIASSNSSDEGRARRQKEVRLVPRPVKARSDDYVR